MKAVGPILFLALPTLAAAQPEEAPPVVDLHVPEGDVGEETLAARREAQLAAAEAIGVDHDFRLEDRLPESGITFVNEVTMDGKRDYKGVHYDHGNGLAVADVDGDGRLDLYFTTQIGRNELWGNLGSGRFEDRTDAAGVGLGDRISVTASFGDLDNDGDPDLFVTTVRMGNVLFANDGDGGFTDVTLSAGVGYVGHSSGTVLFDYDRDGLLDVFVTNVGLYTTDERGEGGYYVGVTDGFQGHLKPGREEASILYRNLGGLRFEDVSREVGLIDEGWSGDATMTDFNRDGFLDLYVLNMQGDDHYWVNEQGQAFVERRAEVFPKSPWGAMGVKVFDWDNDLRMDMVLTDMHSDMSQEVGPEREKLKSDIQFPDWYLQGGFDNIFGNAFWANRGGDGFVEISDRIGVENYWPWGVSVGDLNADGFQDLLITSSMNFPWRYGVNSLLLNDRGERFADAEFVLGIEPRRGGRIRKEWDLLDCAAAEREHSFCADKEPAVYQVWGTLGTRAAAIFDLEGDGDLDIVTNDYHSEPMVLVSDLAQRRTPSFIEVQLQGSASNRDGLGALVRVVAGEREWIQRLDGKSGYLSQSSMPLYFGLGDTREVDRIVVEWPSGQSQEVTEGLATNRLIEIREPSAAG